MRYLFHLLFVLASLCFSCNSGIDSDEKNGAISIASDGPLFTLLNHEQTGVDFVNRLRETPELNVLTFKYFSNGGGVALGDINNDGLTDIYLTGNLGPNRLFLNEGNLKFKDITRSAGVDGGRGWANGTVMVDINSDGYLDIYVCRSGNFSAEMRANQFFINNGDLTFTDRAAELGLNDPAYSTHAAFFDFDLDNDLDMYLLNHNIRVADNLPLDKLKNTRDPLVGDKLFRNDNGKFTDVSSRAGILQNTISYGLGVGIGDLNGDAWPDIYVCNDFMEQDYLYINDGDGTFREELESAVGHTSNFSMGCDIADYNNDGRMDILVTDMAAEDNFRSKTNMSGMNPEKFWKAVDNGFHYQYMVNTLQLNRGMTKFSEVGQLAGISYTDWSWAPLFADFDNDGLKDILITNGYRKASRNNDFIKKKDEYYAIMARDKTVDQKKMIMELLAMMPEDNLPNYIYKNNGDLTFTKKTEAWGFSTPSFSNGAAYADLDNDGDLDLVINNIDQPCHIYRNNAEKGTNNFVRVKLQGPAGNPDGIGARVVLVAAGMKQHYEVNPSRGYLSSVDKTLNIGVGPAQQVETLLVEWPDQSRMLLSEQPVNEVITVAYQKATPKTEGKKPTGGQYFTDITNASGIDYEHQENDYDDFQTEVLLPHRMSALGPGLAVADINGDGLEDFYVTGCKEQPGALYVQDPGGKFQPVPGIDHAPLTSVEGRDAAFFDLEADGQPDLYIVGSGYEHEAGHELYRDRLVRNAGWKLVYDDEMDAKSPSVNANGSCVVAADFDNDGFQDLFVGGGALPGRYPYADESFLLRSGEWEGERRLQDMTSKLAPDLQDAGIVNCAVFADVNGDELSDLILAGEWTPIQVFLNNKNGVFSRAEQNGLGQTTGWWFSLATADIDLDGDMDIIAGNLGKNYKYKASENEPFHIYAGDLDGTGTQDVYLGYAQDGKVFPVRGRECSSQQMPYIKSKFETYTDFGKATLKEVLGESIDKALHLEAHMFESVWLENDGSGSFLVHELPVHAQFSSVNGIVVHDIDQDDRPDLILAGNLFGSEVETPRNDASYGLVLLNTSDGFRSLGPEESGFLADGDVKSLDRIKLASGSYGILVARNNGPVSLFEISGTSSQISMR